MDYVVGSVAALITGNVTPNRPKLIRRALTPTKHPQSPNVTPKSEIEDRSIFLSPTLQKKKAIVKKSPKRIFQNTDLDSTEDCEGNSNVNSPKAEKVKKHLKNDLENNTMAKEKSVSLNASSENVDSSSKDVSPKKKAKVTEGSERADSNALKKKKRNTEVDGDHSESKLEESNLIKSPAKSPKTTQIHKSDIINQEQDDESKINDNKKSVNDTGDNTTDTPNKKKKKKNKLKIQSEKSDQSIDNNPTHKTVQNKSTNKKKKLKKKKSQQSQDPIEDTEMDVEKSASGSEEEITNVANPNAITNKDTDSEHESDDEMESENEQENEKSLKNEEHKASSDEDEKPDVKEKKPEPKEREMSEDEIKRTLFVGNVPYSSKCKKEIKKIFHQYGQIETIRIRTIPVKDARVTPKLAIIKNELHPERSTVNVYVKYTDEDSVTQALSANNTILNGHHLRVSRSASTGAEHDPRLAVFVGNLPFGIEDETLRAKFEPCGEIVSVRVVRDKKTNAGKGFGYVNFATKDGVELALALTDEDLTIKNRILRVNRCTQSGSKGQKRPANQKFGQRENQWNQRKDQGRGQGQNQGRNFGQNQGRGHVQNQGRNFGQNQGRDPGQNQGRMQGQNMGNRNQGQNMGNRNKGQNMANRGQGQSQGIRSRNQGKWNQGGNQGRFQDRNQWSQGTQNDAEATGAARRLMFKRKQQDGGDAPPNKRPNVAREKKPKKEFVGMTAEKKKKQKFNKDSKKKKALSEILTKKL